MAAIHRLDHHVTRLVQTLPQDEKAQKDVFGHHWGGVKTRKMDKVMSDVFSSIYQREEAIVQLRHLYARLDDVLESERHRWQRDKEVRDRVADLSTNLEDALEEFNKQMVLETLVLRMRNPLHKIEISGLAEEEVEEVHQKLLEKYAGEAEGHMKKARNIVRELEHSAFGRGFVLDKHAVSEELRGRIHRAVSAEAI